jgi:hypothetical protein
MEDAASIDDADDWDPALRNLLISLICRRLRFTDPKGVPFLLLTTNSNSKYLFGDNNNIMYRHYAFK